jgi:hypothetical protein
MDISWILTNDPKIQSSLLYSAVVDRGVARVQCPPPGRHPL